MDADEPSTFWKHFLSKQELKGDQKVNVWVAHTLLVGV
jgi:hypothetical protein